MEREVRDSKLRKLLTGKAACFYPKFNQHTFKPQIRKKSNKFGKLSTENDEWTPQGDSFHLTGLTLGSLCSSNITNRVGLVVKSESVEIVLYIHIVTKAIKEINWILQNFIWISMAMTNAFSLYDQRQL